MQFFTSAQIGCVDLSYLCDNNKKNNNNYASKQECFDSLQNH